MLRQVAALGVAGIAGALAADRLMARAREGRAPDPVSMQAVVDAPVERVWAAIVDVPFQVERMAEMRELVLDPPGRAHVGQRGEATVRILGISVTDQVEIAALDPPRRYEIRHLGLFKGGGVIALEAGGDGTTTIVRWHETLTPPILPELGARLQTPILRSIFQADLERLKRLVEDGAVA